MKKIALIFLVTLISCAVFAKQKRIKKHRSRGCDIISVSAYRTACFGRCPEYMIEINTDGNATYTGIRFVPDTGIFRKNIGKASAMKVIDEFIKYRVDTCRDLYQNRVQDLPGLNITIKYKDSTKTIRNANFGPFFLKQLATAIDDAGKKTDDTWQKAGIPKN